MALSLYFPWFFLFCLATAAPLFEENKDGRIIITNKFYPDSLAVYSGEHEIVNIVVPLNNLNNGLDSEENDNVIIFFVEADKDEAGKRIDQGLYVLKGEEVKKLLDNGRDAAAAYDDSDEVYFGAADGLYIYNKEENTAVKYGSVTDSIIGIAKTTGSDLIFILTEDRELYKISDNGDKKVKLDEIQNAEQIVLDYSNNLYFYGEDKQPYVYDGFHMKKIEGLPENPVDVTLLKPSIYSQDRVPLVVDDSVYLIYADGTSKRFNVDFEPDAKPSAYAMEAATVQYYAHNNKIYEYNTLYFTFGQILDELNELLDNYLEMIEDLIALLID